MFEYIATTTAFFGYPSMIQAQFYCYAFRLAIGGSLGLLIAMHGVIISSYVAFHSNSGRKSLVGVPFDIERYTSKDFAIQDKSAGNSLIPKY